MKRVISTVLICFLLLFLSGFFIPFPLFAQEKPAGNRVITLKPGSSEKEIIECAALVTPSERQLNWQRLETTAFIHFGLNTFYNQEWGLGTEDPGRFNPTLLNTDQWAKVISDAGFKMLIMTCKHHDGFCLWPSKFTNYTVAASPWLNGKGDLVEQVAASCRKYNLKFGIYLSPWDRHEASYGNSVEYNNFFINQLTELLTNYGSIDEVWFDGACGEGLNGKKQVYDWNSYYSIIRKLQPKAVIAVMGPDVRWVGTESGYGRETEWSVLPYEYASQDKIADLSQKNDIKNDFLPPGDMENQDLGSRFKIREAKNLIWYPSEVDVSIRPGWFWHESENSRVKLPEKLLDIYFSSVGRNSVLLLNIPPDSLGLIYDADIESLHSFRNSLQSIFKNNLAEKGILSTSDIDLNISILTDKNDTTSWIPFSETPYCFEAELKEISDFDVLLLQEDITKGQRIEHFILEAWVEEGWKKITEGTTVGYKRLLRFPVVQTKKVRLTIDRSRLTPALAEFGLYRQLPVATANPASAAFSEFVEVNLSCDDKDASVFYTLNGSAPGNKSNKYTIPIKLSETATLCYVAIRNDGISGFPSKKTYRKALHGITLVYAPDEKYGNGNPLGLVDGVTGSADFADGGWTGFNGTDLEATINLGSAKDLNEFGITFNENTKSWIFRPQLVEFAVSDDGIQFRNIYTKLLDKPGKDNEQLIPLSFTYKCRTQYIRVKAINFGKLPDWHPGKGEPAWLFVDEIIAR